MDMPRVFVDFHNSDEQGRVRLNTLGSIEDLDRAGVVMRNGSKLLLYGDEMEAEGEVVFSTEEGIWTAKIDWEAIRNHR